MPLSLRRVAVLCAFCFLAGCASFKGPQSSLTSEGPTQKQPKGVPVSEQDRTLINKFAQTYNASYAATSAPKDAPIHQEFLAAGLQLVKSSCDDFFRALGEERQDMDFAETMIGIGGSAGTAAAGVFGASAKTLTLLAAGIATALGITEGYSNVYLFGPDTESVKQLVDTAQGAYLSKLKELSVTSFYEAHGYIQGYQGICEVQAIKGLVNEAVRKGNIKAKTSAQDALVGQKDAAAISAIERIVETSPLSRRQLAALYWLFIIRPDESAQSAILEELKSLKYGPVQVNAAGVASFRNDSGYEDEKRDIQTWLTTLSTSERSQLQEVIAQIEAEKGIKAAPLAGVGAAPAEALPPAPPAVPSVIILEVE